MKYDSYHPVLGGFHAFLKLLRNPPTSDTLLLFSAPKWLLSPGFCPPLPHKRREVSTNSMFFWHMFLSPTFTPYLPTGGSRTSLVFGAYHCHIAHGRNLFQTRKTQMMRPWNCNTSRRNKGFSFPATHLSNEIKPWLFRLSRWWFQIFFISTPTWGRWTHFDSYFSIGLVQPPTS